MADAAMVDAARSRWTSCARVAVGADLGRLLADGWWREFPCVLPAAACLGVCVCYCLRLCAFVSFVSLCRAFAFGLF